MSYHQVTFNVSAKATLASDDSETRVNLTLVMEVDSLTGKIGCITWPTITELNSVRSTEDRLGSFSQYSISSVQKAYDSHRLGDYMLPGKR